MVKMRAKMMATIMVMMVCVEVERRGRRSVSYTHLTLPTKRIV